MGRIKKIQKAIDFIEYISKPMKKEDMFIYYKINNIILEKTELYSDFIYGLYDLISSTYMGDEITDVDEQTNHFNWCWDKTIDNFKKEGINFVKDEELYDYFKMMFQESFYKEKNKSSDSLSNLKKYWVNIFNYGNIKTNSELESLIDVYKLFEKSIST